MTERVPCYLTCENCDSQTTETIDPSDTGGQTIRYYCESCEDVTEHETGSARFGSLGA